MLYYFGSVWWYSGSEWWLNSGVTLSCYSIVMVGKRPRDGPTDGILRFLESYIAKEKSKILNNYLRNLYSEEKFKMSDPDFIFSYKNEDP